jgi:hypothetical protein
MRCALNLTSSTHKHVGAQVCVEVFDLYDDTTPISRHPGRSRSTKRNNVFFEPRTTCAAAVALKRATPYDATGSYECATADELASPCQLTTPHERTAAYKVAKRKLRAIRPGASRPASTLASHQMR